MTTSGGMSWSEFSLQMDKVLKELEVHHTVMAAHTWNNVYKSYARVQEESWQMKVGRLDISLEGYWRK